MDELAAKPVMSVRLQRAGMWLVPFAVLAVLRVVVGTSDGFFALPENRVPPTRVDELINVATFCSLWFGLLACLARLVWDDSPRLTAALITLMILMLPIAVRFVMYVVLT